LDNTTQLTVKRVPLDAIHQDPANARSHPDENLEAIEASLRRFGQAEPLVVQASTGRVIGGNGRLAVMKKLGWPSCDVVELEIDDLTATALGIALNRTAESATWNQEALAGLLRELQAQQALDGTGFDDEDLDALLAELGEEVEPADVDDPGEQEPPEKPVSRTGDPWILGDHRLLVGDSTSAADVERLMAGEKASLLSTDPPYCVAYTGNDRPIHDGKPSGKDWTHVYREIDIADLGEFLDKALSASLPHLEDDAGIYVWHAHVQQPTIAAAFERHGLLLHQVLVWVKPCATFGHCYYRWKHEPCAFGWKQGHKPKHGVGQLETVWEADWDGKQRITSFHPTSKPTRLFEIPIEQHTRAGAIVPEKLRRRCRAIDVQPAFVDGTILRWQIATGKQATLDGKTFEAVSAERRAS
jgi:DNA modification methylase